MQTPPSESPEIPTGGGDEVAYTRHLRLPTPGGLTKMIPDRTYRGKGELVVRLLFGSWAHGTQTQDSDEDWRGVFQLPNAAFLGLDAPKTTYEAKPDQVYHELGHFLRLLLKGNPNMVGMLFAPDDVVIETSPTWKDLILHRNHFISRRMASAYRGWLYGELMQAEKQGAKFPQKRLSHVPRLAYELHDAVLYGFIPVRLAAGTNRHDFVMGVKEGRIELPAVSREVNSVLEEIEPAVDGMPEAPRELAQQLLLDYRGV